MLTYLLSCILGFITLTTYTSDDRMLILQSNDGTCITIPSLDASCSGLLNDMINHCPINQIVPVDDFDAQELTLLANVLNMLNTSKTHEDAIKSLRHSFTPDVFELTPQFLSLCCLDDFFDIPILRKMLLHYVAYAPNSCNDWALRDKETIALVCEKLQAANNCGNLCHNDHIALKYLIGIIKDTQLEDKKRFLESKGEIKGPFFTDVSVGEIASLDIIDIRYKYYNSSVYGQLRAYVGPPRDMPSLENMPTSIDGLICDITEDITDINKREKLLSICNTGISYLPANSFQRVHSPTELELFNNKLVTIHPEAFAGLHTLKTLYLGNCNNTFAQMPVGTLDHLKNLINLTLYDVSFNPLLLKYCSKLKTLILDNNHLPEMPSWWPQACASLEHLTIQHNKIQSIPPSFLDYFPRLKSFSFAYNNIRHIHVDMFNNRKNLIYFNLVGNPIPQQEIDALRSALPHIKIT